jgi:hypothetical protein
MASWHSAYLIKHWDIILLLLLLLLVVVVVVIVVVVVVVVVIATDYGLDDEGVGFRIPLGQEF